MTLMITLKKITGRGGRPMPLFRRDEQIVARAVSGLAQGNPFLPERIEHERQALGSAFVVANPVWHLNVDRPENPNVAALSARAAELLETARRRLDAGGRGARLVEDEADLYEDLVFYALFAVGPDGSSVRVEGLGDTFQTTPPPGPAPIP